MHYCALSLRLLVVWSLGMIRAWYVDNARLCKLSLNLSPLQIANVLVMTDFLSRWPITPLQKGSMSEYDPF